MKRIIVILILSVSLSAFSGCASVKKFFTGKPDWEKVEMEDEYQGSSAITAKKVKQPKPRLVISKRQAISTASNYADAQGLNDTFRTAKASKVKRYLTQDRDQTWIWEVYFSAKDKSFWKFWRKSPMMVEVDGVSGEVRSWGRR